MKICRVILVIVCAFCSVSALAGHGIGLVETIQVTGHSHMVAFGLDDETIKFPRCNESHRFSINLNEPGGSAAYHLVVEAKKHKLKLRVVGNGTCRNEWKAEDVKSIVLQ